MGGCASERAGRAAAAVPGAVAPAPAEARPAALGPGRLAGGRLPGVAGGAARVRVLEHRQLHRGDHPPADHRQLHHPGAGGGLPGHHPADGRPGRRRHRGRRGPWVPGGVLHGQGGPAPLAAAAAGGRAHPAVGQLPGQGVRLAGDGGRRRGAGLGPGPGRAARPRVRAGRGLAGPGLPVAALHDPAHLRRPRPAARLAARGLVRSGRPRPADLPVGDPAPGPAGGGGRVDLHLLADPGRLRGRQHRRRQDPDDRQRHLRQRRRGQQPALRGRPGLRAGGHHGGLPAGRPAGRGAGEPLMHLSGSARVALRVVTAVVLVFVYLPLLVVVVNSFNPDRVASWPPDGFTVDWWARAWDNPGARAALWTSVKAATGATVVALVLGTLLSFAVQRFRFFGRETLSLLVVLPIALPGIVTGIALQSAFRFLGVPLSLWTIVVGHATFCIVVVFNNTVARLRRMSRSLEEASMDLGADGAQTFRLVTFPALRTALLAGALLAFALSFDEIIVTTFTAGAGDQTLPIWIFTNLTRPNQAPVVNVVAVLLVLISVVPIWLAQRLSEGTVRGAGAGAVAAR